MERRHIVWDEEKSARLYDYIAECSPDNTEYFGYQVGRGIVNFCKYICEDINNIECLDYGCGMGHLINYFLEDGVRMYGVDLSKESVDMVNKKFEGNVNWCGARVFDGERLPYEDDTFGLITCTEVIEHVIPKHMDLLLEELFRILKVGGVILFTTPNNENMRVNSICCPECNTIFHRYGHCNSFSKASLVELMEAHGFITMKCEATDFFQFQRKSRKVGDISFNMCKRIIRDYFRYSFDNKNGIDSNYFQDRMNLTRTPNLFFVGTK